jgi:hypothetical protein
MAQIANRYSWQTSALPEQLTQLTYTDSFTQAEYETIARGLIPRAMEDRWFIFYEEPMLYLYRSWSGQFIYRVTLARDDVGARVVCAECPAEYQSDPTLEKLLPWIIRHLLLGQNLAFPKL